MMNIVQGVTKTGYQMFYGVPQQHIWAAENCSVYLLGRWTTLILILSGLFMVW